MEKVTTPQLASRLSELTGLPESMHLQIQRRAREAGYVSQEGHGRGAASATAEDAAIMLLISLTGLSPRYSEIIAAALLEAEPDLSQAGSFNVPGKNVVEAVAYLIRNNVDFGNVIVHSTGLLAVIINSPGMKFINYEPPRQSQTAQRLFNVIHRRTVAGVVTNTLIEPWVFDEINGILGPVGDEVD